MSVIHLDHEGVIDRKWEGMGRNINRMVEVLLPSFRRNSKDNIYIWDRTLSISQKYTIEELQIAV